MKGFAELPSLRDVLTGDLAVPGRWHVANVGSAPYWTVKVQKVVYRSLDIFIMPHTKEGTYPALAARCGPGQSDQDVRRILSGFLSALCWTLGGGALVEAWSGGNRPSALGGYAGRIARTPSFELDYLPDPTDPKGRLALALCREAAGLNTASHAVISYFRVFETHFQEVAREIKEWINANYQSITDFQSMEALARLQASQVDVGHYLYDSCRSAAAHGKVGKDVVIDPDDPEDERRLLAELPLIRALAVKLTEEILGVQTVSTIYREHLYELAGFKALFGEEIVAKVLAGDPISEGTLVNIPALNVGLMNRPAFPALSGMNPSELRRTTAGVHILLDSAGGHLQLALLLKFDNERLEFNPDKDLYAHDDGSAEAALAFADAIEFLKWLFLNGRLKIENADTGELIARKDPFVPVNVIVDPAGFDSQVEHWQKMGTSRRSTGQ